MHVYRGHARFTGPRTVSVNGERLEADKIIINTGGRAVHSDHAGLETVPYFTNSSMMEVDFLPEHLLIVGGSYIGLEFAQAYRRFGARVTVVEMADRLIAREDPDVSDAVREILEAEGGRGSPQRQVPARSKRTQDGIAMTARLQHRSAGDRGHPSAARRRSPAEHRRSRSRQGRGRRPMRRATSPSTTSAAPTCEGIWAIGDVNGRGAFTHTSYNDFEIVAANIFDNDPRRISDRIPCYGLFIDPPLGRVGMTEREVRAKGIKALCRQARMTTSVGRAASAARPRDS